MKAIKLNYLNSWWFFFFHMTFFTGGQDEVVPVLADSCSSAEFLKCSYWSDKMEHVTEAIGQARAVMAAHGTLWMAEAVRKSIFLSIYLFSKMSIIIELLYWGTRAALNHQ